ncbi:MAG: tRNA (adenosine(37)-N6)-dimethylallyltransferase MiaA [Candidatus Altimarinota bacterium]
MMGLSHSQIEDQIASWQASSQKPLLVVVGPTASGKTKLAVELAKEFDGEVINADSRQIYQGIEIGNALTKPEEMQGIPHHLFSSFPLDRHFSVAEYKRLAEQKIEDIQRRGKLPILCGGTLMWVDSVVDNYVIPETQANHTLRAELDLLSADELLSQLNEVDPESAEQLSKERNKRYIIRALEIFHQTGKIKSALAKKGKRKYDVFKVAPRWDREKLYERINERTREQLEQGMIEEVQALVDQFAGGSIEAFKKHPWPGLTSIGCKEVIPYLKGDLSKDQLLSQLQQNNRNYAKRQLTWLRKDKEVNWIEME